MSKSYVKEIHGTSKLPCFSCMKYMAKDIKNSKINRDRTKILAYLSNISDPDILRKLLDLLKSLTQL